MTPTLSDADRQLLHQVAQRLVNWRLGVLAVFLLEMYKPLAFVGSQFLLVMGPIMHLFVPPTQYDRLAELLSQRDHVEFLLREIEGLETPKR